MSEPCIPESLKTDLSLGNDQINSFQGKKIYCAFWNYTFYSYFTTCCISSNEPQDVLYSWAFFEGKKSQGHYFPEKCFYVRWNTSVMFYGTFFFISSLPQKLFARVVPSTFFLPPPGLCCCCCLNILFIFERERQRQSMSGGGAEREREREAQNRKQAPGSELSAQSLMRGWNSQTSRS